MHKNKKRNLKEKEESIEKKPRMRHDEEISSEEEEEDFEVDADNLYEVTSESEDEVKPKKTQEKKQPEPETPKESLDEIRVRQATSMLNKIKQIVGEQPEEEQKESQDPILMKLRMEEKRASSRVPPNFEKNIENFKYSDKNLQFLRGHKKSPTCVCLSPDDQYVFTGAKDGCIIKWNLSNSNKTIIKNAHKGHVLSIAISTDGKFLATGGRDKQIKIWDPETTKLIETFETAHSGEVHCLAFQMGSHQLFSGSTDRVVKVWDCEEMAYVESLYGHEGPVFALDSMFQNVTVSTGEDRSLRYWKVEQESQLILKGQKESIDCMAMFNDANYFSGSQDGSLALWNKTKKKPKHVFGSAHAGKWICSVGTFKFSNVAASGSSDGFLKFWKGENELQMINQIPIDGFINGVAFSKGGKFIVASVGQEHRLGRWNSQKVKNGIVVYKF